MPLETNSTLDIGKALVRMRKTQDGPKIYFKPFEKLIPSIPAGTLMTVGGYVGSFKTTFGYNFAYTNAVYGGKNSVILSLEMTRDEIYLRLSVRHGLHPKFGERQDIRFSRLKAGTWSRNEEEFYNKNIVPDFQNTTEAYRGQSYAKGQVCVVDPEQLGNVQADSVEELLDYVLHRIDEDMPGGLDILIVDYVQLLGSELQVKAFEDNFKNTKIIARYMKNLALGFRSFEWEREPGLTIVLLSQLSRAAYQGAYESIYRAKKKGPERYENIYNVTAFAESTEIERASDICITLYSDDSLRNGQGATVIAQLLKNRQGERNEAGERMLALADNCYIGDINVLSSDPELERQHVLQEIDEVLWTLNHE